MRLIIDGDGLTGCQAKNYWLRIRRVTHKSNNTRCKIPERSDRAGCLMKWELRGVSHLKLMAPRIEKNVRTLELQASQIAEWEQLRGIRSRDLVTQTDDVQRAKNGLDKASSGKKMFALIWYDLFGVLTSHNTGLDCMDSGYAEGRVGLIWDRDQPKPF